MPRTLALSHAYPLSAGALFARVVQYAELAEAMQGMAAYDGLPEGEAQVGQRFTVNVRLGGWLPTPPWTIEIIARDNTARRLQSLEHGGPVRRWAHTIEIDAAPDGGSLMRDTVEIEAGLFTSFYVAQARGMYLARHRARARLLGLAADQAFAP